MKLFAALVLAAVTAVPSVVFAQLSGTVGPTSSSGNKKSKKICNVLDYGAKADAKTDLGPALTKAWNACATGGLGERLSLP
jgi:rhamnogalacturonan hydrolase